MQRILGLVLALLIFPPQAVAQTITAVCKNPTGQVVGIESSGVVVNKPDGITGGQFVITWAMGAKTAQVVAQGAGGGPPITETAYLVHYSDEQISFVVDYPKAVWLYSLFLRPGHLLITRHVNGFVLSSGGAICIALHAPCDISAK